MTRMPSHVFLNGRTVAAQRASISVFDRGFLYGDALFETVRSYRGKILALDDHLQRLQTAAARLRIRLPQRDWGRDIAVLLGRCGLAKRDAAVRITVTRGAGVPSLIPPKQLDATVLIVATPLRAAIRREQARGIGVIVLPFGRAGYFAQYKTVDYLPAIVGRIHAQEHGASEALFVERGRITEATTANVFVVHDRCLLTPPLRGVLPGVTRKWAIAAARKEGITVRETSISRRLLDQAAEVFLTSSVVEVLPVTKIDQRIVGNGAVGAITRRVQHGYRQMVDQALSLRASP